MKERLIPQSMLAVAWDVHLHITGAVCGSSDDINIVSNSGKKYVCRCARPEYAAIINQVAAAESKQNGTMCAVLCGLEAMTTSAAKACAGANVDYHVETFGW
jgi:hypothetical protein